MDKPHQRIGALSNSHVGAAFEKAALEHYLRQGQILRRDFPLDIGVANVTKRHVFDLGSDEPKVIIECKSHKWTSGGLVPSAKMTTWNEAMYYFHLAPPEYRKIFFTLHHRREASGETLVAYYKRTYAHLIPTDVEFVEFDEVSGQVFVE